MPKMTTEQFLSHLGIEVGQEFKVNINDNPNLTYRVNKFTNIEGLDLYYKNDLYKGDWISSREEIKDLLDKEITPLPKYTLTEDEKAIVKNIDNKWKWIHRTNEEIMFIATCDADFNSTYKTWNYDSGHYFNRFPYAEKVFTFIGFGESVSLDELRKCL